MLFARAGWVSSLIFFSVQPHSTLFCDEDDKVIMEIRMADAKRLGVAGFMTEWQVTIVIIYYIAQEIAIR